MSAGLVYLCFALDLVAQTPAAPGEIPLLQPPALLAAPAPAPAISLEDFARSFVPAPGNYEVMLLHPTKCYPVKVCFTLPPGCPKVHVTKRQIEFDYGKHTVRIRFPILGGGVKVRQS